MNKRANLVAILCFAAIVIPVELYGNDLAKTLLWGAVGVVLVVIYLFFPERMKEEFRQKQKPSTTKNIIILFVVLVTLGAVINDIYL